MVTIPNQWSVAKVFQELDQDGANFSSRSAADRIRFSW